MASKKNVFISFDYDNDEALRNLFAGQAKHTDSPFDIIDRSVKEPLQGDWKTKVKARVGRADVVAVICGANTHTATGVAFELQAAKDQSVPYFLLTGYKDKVCTKPTTASAADKMYDWTWDNLKLLIHGSR
ncbi:MAG: TIR domain-containing protein [Bdellovibrionales bacterium]